MWTVDALERPTELNPYTYWVGGRRKKEIVDELNKSSAANLVVIRGKYGVGVPEGYNNGIGDDNIGSNWVGDYGFGLWMIDAGTNILLANGSEAFQQSDKGTTYPWGVKRESGCYIYPQDTRTYTTATAGTDAETAQPQMWLVPFNCLSTIEAGMFTGHTAEADPDSPTGYTQIMSGVAKWEGDRFDQESSYDVTTGEYTYGTHRLNIYPYSPVNYTFDRTIYLTNCENAVAFARNEYTITYNTCYVNDDGTLVREPNGDIILIFNKNL